MSTSDFDDTPLTHAEELDSDEIRNADGDETVSPPDRWLPVKDDESLDERLADEVPDVSDEVPDVSDAESDEPPTDAHDSERGGGLDVVSDDVLDRIDTDRYGIDRGQIDGTPEDGDSFFDVAE